LEGADAVEWDRLGHGQISLGSGSRNPSVTHLPDR
jgi:hypothetical protein